MKTGNIQLDGQYYQVDVASYKGRDIIDFSPRVATAGGNTVFTELGLYQVQVMSDWDAGFGFQWYRDAEGYLRTDGEIDSRHSGMVMRMTTSVKSSTNSSGDYLDGMVSWVPSSASTGQVFAWDTAGLHRYSTGTWGTVWADAGVNYALVTGEFIIVFPELARPEYSTSGEADVAGKAWGCDSQGANKDLYFQAYAGSSTGNSVTVTYESGGTAGSETVAVATAAITVTIESGVSTATQIKAAIEADADAYGAAGLLGEVGYRSGHDGTGAPSTFATALTLSGGSSNGRVGEYQTQLGTAQAELLYKTVLQSSDAPVVDIAYESGGTAGDEVVSLSTGSTGHEITITFESAVTTATQLITALRGDIPTVASITTKVDGDDNDLTFIADTTGIGGNQFSVLYTLSSTGTAGAEVVTVDTDNHQHAITIFEGTTALQVKDAVNACSSAVLSASVKTGEAGNGKVAAMGEVFLRGGMSGEVADLVTVELASGNDGTGVVSTMASAMVLQGHSGNRSWFDAGVDTDALNFKWANIYGGHIYASVDETSRIHYTEKENASHLEGTTDDPALFYAGLKGAETFGAINFQAKQMISAPDGLYAMAESKDRSEVVLDYKDLWSTDNFRSMAIHNGQLVYPVRNNLFQWNGYRISPLNPAALTETYPFTTYGRFDNFVVKGDYLFMSARTNEATYEEHIICFDGVGWHKMAEPITDGDGSITSMHYDPHNDYLWYHIHKTADDLTYYIQFDPLSEFPYPAFATSTGHQIYTPRLDMGYRRVTKNTPSVFVAGSNLSSDHYIDLYYAVDGGADSDFLPWGGDCGVTNRLSSNGVKEFYNPTGEEDSVLSYNWILYKIELVTETSTGNPVLEDFAPRFIMLPDVLYGYSMLISASPQAKYGMSADDRSPKEIVDSLKALRAGKKPFEFIDIHGDKHVVQMASITEMAVKQHEQETRGDPTIESRVMVNLVEMISDGTKDS